MRNFVYTFTADLILFLRSLKLFIDDEKKSLVRVSWPIKLKFYFLGFLSQSIANYDLPSNNYKNYVSDWYRFFRITPINLCNNDLINDKFLFHDHFKNNPRVVRPLALIKDGQLSAFDTDDTISVKSLLALGGDLICKPQKGGRGDDIHVIKNDNDLEKLKHLIQSGRNYIVQKLIVQDGLPQTINPNSLNTLRILTMVDPITQKPFIAKTVQRFGTLRSAFVDNFSAGGMVVDIDIDTGIYKKGAIRTEGHKIEYLGKHPNSSVVFEGKQIDNWPEIKNGVIELSQQLQHLKYLAWDVIPFKSDFKILEANSNSDLNLLQLFGGLLENERIKKFYRHNGKLKNPKCVFKKIKSRYIS